MSPRICRLRVAVLASCAWFAVTDPLLVAAPITLLHSFAGGPNDGTSPNSSGTALVSNGTALFGITSSGGNSDQGVLFSINEDGSDYQVLRKLSGPDGVNPVAGLTLAGSTLYGTAQSGITNNGTVYSLNTDGTGFQILHAFPNAGGGGTRPSSAVTLINSSLYGTTQNGGANSSGTIYSLNTDGTNFQQLYSFGAASGDGLYPVIGLTQGGSTLYGGTVLGGNGGGTVFSINTDGTGYQILHSFSGSNFVGTGPSGDLLVAETRLYGTTRGEVSLGEYGTVFSMNLDGTDFQSLHSFSVALTDGIQPVGSLLRVGGTLMGITKLGGELNMGAIYSMNLDGSQFKLLHSFTGPADDGRNPHSGLILSGDQLYGTTQGGGAGSRGTIYTLAVPEPSTMTGFGLGATGVLIARGRAGRYRRGSAQRRLQA